MKIIPKSRSKFVAIIGMSLALFTFLFYAANRVHGTGPGMTLALTGSNQVTLSVTNGVTNGLYEIWWTEFLTPSAQVFTNGPWTLLYSSTTPGQTNFNLTLLDTSTAFFRAVNSEDFDNDGTPNYEDSRPWDGSNGLLRVTIETPANGSNVP